jgi:hypothetical protein
MPGVRRYSLTGITMKTLLYFAAIFLPLLAVSPTVLAKEWRGIVPLRSNRGDVERLLGPARECQHNVCTYRMKEEAVVTVSYSDGPLCDGSCQGGWLVPRDTVVQVQVWEVYDPEKGGTTLSDLKVDKSRLREERGHIPVSDFIDDEEGVTYTVQTVARYVTRDGKRVAEGQPDVVTTITYTPAAKDKSLRCPDSPPGAPNNGMHPTADTIVLKFLPSLGAAGDAWR